MQKLLRVQRRREGDAAHPLAGVTLEQGAEGGAVFQRAAHGGRIFFPYDLFHRRIAGGKARDELVGAAHQRPQAQLFGQPEPERI